MNLTDEIDITRQWISQFVIKLNLCPFARKVYDAGEIRYVLSEATDTTALLTQLVSELDLLSNVSAKQVETTFLIHPKVLGNFFDYNDFLAVAERMLSKTGRNHDMQIASFHPQYEFCNADPDAVENYSNRSPFPMVHILRTASVAKVTSNKDEMLAIPARNIETLQTLGVDDIIARLTKITGTGY